MILFNRFLFLNYVFQMSITDAFYAFTFETSNAGEMSETSSFPDWLSRLAYQLINNEFDQLSLASPPHRRSSTSATGAPAVIKSHEQHSLHNLSLLSPYNGTRRLSTCTLLRKVPRHFVEVYCMNLNLHPVTTPGRTNEPSQAMQRQKLQEENRTVLCYMFQD
jgi:hypothetical protein